MAWTLYDYRSARGENNVLEWCKRLQKSELARLNQKLDLLAEKGHELSPGLLAGPLRGWKHLYKIRVNGSVAVRLIVCKGPIRMEQEYTILFGAFERDDELPAGILETADDCRQQVIKDQNRRGLHERATR